MDFFGMTGGIINLLQLNNWKKTVNIISAVLISGSNKWDISNTVFNVLIVYLLEN